MHARRLEGSVMDNGTANFTYTGGNHCGGISYCWCRIFTIIKSPTSVRHFG